VNSTAEPQVRNMTEFGAKYGPVAVVTGAARGIGAGFARVLAARGLDLILTDIDAEALRHTATDIGRRTARRVKTTTLDMTDPEAPQALSDFSSSDDIGLVVANHLRPGGSWRVLDTDLDQLHAQLGCNVRAYIDLAHVFGRRLRDRGSGGLILMSSLTAVVGAPFVTTYGASKAFILAFGSGLGYELGAFGVDVLTLVPSSVNTETYQKSARKPSRIFPAMEVDEFVVAGLSSLGRRWVAIPGRRNVLAAAVLTRLLPRQYATSIMGRNMQTMLETG
jgi:short-subunit dehydrogenase